MRITGATPLRKSENLSVELAIAYIKRNFKEAINAYDLSSLFFIPEKKLQEAIKEKTGKTIHHFQNTIRLQVAKQFLMDDDMTIKQITYAVGLKRTSHFDQLFKDQEGITPMEYRTLMSSKRNHVFRSDDSPLSSMP